MEDTLPRPTMEMSASFLVLVSSILFGGVVIAVGYFVRRFSRAKLQKDESQNVQKPEEHRRDSPSTSRPTAVGGNGGVSAPSNKRAKNKKRRGAQQEFSHSWVVGTLKGHTAPVLDINFSSNGKFLASCAEDCGLRSKEEVLEPGAERYEKVGNRETSSTAKTSGSESTEPESVSSAMESINRWTTDPPTPKDFPVYARNPTTGVFAEELRRSGCCLSRCNRINEYLLDMYTVQDDDPDYNSATVEKHNDDEYGIIQANEERVPNVFASAHPAQEHVETTYARRSIIRQENIYLNRERRALAYLSDAKLISLLGNYVLTRDETWALGYPTPSGMDATLIGNFMSYNQSSMNPHLDVNAREFVPRLKCTPWAANESEADSGNGSGSSENSDLEAESSSDSEKENGEQSSASSSSGSASPQPVRSSSTRASRLSAKARHCARCSKTYFVHRETGQQVNEENCVYHWGKLRRGYFSPATGYMADTWSCCHGSGYSRGCTTDKVHVWTGLEYGCNGPFNDYVRTKPSPVTAPDGNYGVYSVDCEMCFTRRGLELTKVSFVALDGTVVYDALVKPEVEVIDYNTRFSGITPAMLAKATKTLKDVQEDILSFVHAETILMGHGLENDLRALKLMHSNVIDTSIVYPHSRGYPYRSSLQTVTRIVLQQVIQNGQHDSVEDARAVLSLMLRKVNDDIS